MSGQHGASALHAQPAIGREARFHGRRRAGSVVLILAALAVLAQTLDMVAGARVAPLQASTAINPLVHASFAMAGPAGSAGMKLLVTVISAVLFVELARSGRSQLACTFLALSAVMGLLGFLVKIL